ncbi:MAG: isoprenyl transferase [Nitrospinota bacterium]
MTKEDVQKKGIDLSRLPEHIAVIMDGNGRWAKKRLLPRIAGHRSGVKTVDRIVTLCREIGIQALTLYSFSLENWSRPASEVNGLMKILQEFLKKELSRMLDQGIRFNTIGNIDSLPDFARDVVYDATQKTKKNNEMVLTLALSYGSRMEIVNAAKRLAKDVKERGLDPDAIDEKVFQSRLYTNDLPEVDLLIRTSGEIRISNFLLWQIAYTELYFTEKLWPDFQKEDLLSAVKVFQERERRFGKTGEQLVDGKAE